MKTEEKIMFKSRFVKFPLLPIILTVVSLFLAVVAISVSLYVRTNYYYSYEGDAIFLSIVIIILSSLFLSGLTIEKATFVKVVTIITHCVLVVTSLAFVIANLATNDIIKFAISMLLLVSSIIILVYFFIMKNDNIKKLYMIVSIISTSLLGAYFAAYITIDIIKYFQEVIENINIQFYFVLASLIVFSLVPLFTNKVQAPASTLEIPTDEQED